MSRIDDELKLLREQVIRIKVFCDAVADTHIQGERLRGILYRKLDPVITDDENQDFRAFQNNVYEALWRLNDRVREIEDKVE